MKIEYRKCFCLVLVLNIASWVLFTLLDILVEFMLHDDMFLDGGLISIPCILTIVYFIVERKIFREICFKARFNIFLICIFVSIVFLFGALDFFFLSKDIIFVPQRGKFLDGIEYILFPFSYGIISLLLGFIIKIVCYISFKIKATNKK